ncbi:MAG: hypothetical protein EHM49_02035, partial [Deltaproteobacteria bacterium]
MATTYTLGSYDFAEDNETVRPHPDRNRIFVLENTLDFSLRPVTGDTDGICQALNIPANTAVLGVWLYVHTVDAGVTDLDVGLADGTEFMEQVSGAVAGYVFDTSQPSNIGGANPGMIFTAADTIDIS